MKLNLRPKHHNHTQNRAYPLATRNLPLIPHSRALDLKFALSPFYKFVDLAFMVLYNYNHSIWIIITYLIAKTKTGALKIFDSNSFETSSFPLHKNSSKPIQTNQNNTKQPQTELKPFKNTLHKARVFLQTQTLENRGLGFGFLPLNLFLHLISSSFFFLIT